MPWTDTARHTYNRKTDRYPSDLTNEEWALLEPMVPPARPGGRPRSTDMRENSPRLVEGGSTMLWNCMTSLSVRDLSHGPQLFRGLLDWSLRMVAKKSMWLHWILFGLITLVAIMASKAGIRSTRTVRGYPRP